MVDSLTTVGEVQKTNTVPLDELMTRLERHCSNDGDPVALFGETSIKSPERTERARYAADAVYDGLMFTLQGIGEYAIGQAKRISPTAKEYEKTARTVETMAQVARALSENEIPLFRNAWLEQRQQAEGDIVHAYKARNFELNGKRYNEVRVFIRPHRYDRPISMRQVPNRPNLKIVETAQARMTIDILPEGPNSGDISIRVDREDALRDYEITYDVVIGKGDVNLLDVLEFPDPQTGQRHGHHFSSSLKAEDFNVTFADILEAANEKFAKKAQEAETPSA